MKFIRHTFFDIVNLHGIGFIDSAGEPTVVSDLYHCAADIKFYTLRSSTNTVDVD